MTWLLRFLQITAAAIAFLFRKKKNRLIAFSCQVFGYVIVKEIERDEIQKQAFALFIVVVFLMKMNTKEQSKPSKNDRNIQRRQ